MKDLELTNIDKVLLEKSKNISITKKRIKMVILFSIISIFFTAYIYFNDFSPKFITILLLIYILITAYEKVSYGFAVIGYKNLIQKMNSYIEELENPTNTKKG